MSKATSPVDRRLREDTDVTPRFVRVFCELVRIDSESGDEDKIMAHLEELFTQELGAQCTSDAFGNLIARVPARDSQRSEPVFLGAHADTVKPGKGVEPVLKEGVLCAASDTILGADNKAGIVEIFEGVRTAPRRPPVEIVITRNEEVGLLGAKHLDLSLVNAKMGFVFDTSELDTVILGGPTHINLDIEVIGKASHAGIRPEEGISAIRTAAKAILNMPEGRIDEETTANVGTIHGGIIRNGVPDRVVIQAECRSLDHNKCIRQADLMRQAFEDAAQKMRATVHVTANIEYKAAQIPEERPVVQAALAAIAASGLEPKAKVSTGGTDAIVLTGRGLETVVLGFGGKQSHSKEEHIAVADMGKAIEIIRHLLRAVA